MILKFLILNVFILNVYCGKPLGVPIERASLYDLSKPFACLDGSGVIPFELVNDDYCDCRDGSDEPGTSACLNGLFSCDNHGYVSSLIPSSRVNDGICDCCDGSDEYLNRNGRKCENTCNEMAEKMRAEQEKAKELLEIGVNKKRDLVQKGVELRNLMRSRLEELESKRANAENEKIVLEEAKNTAEAKAKEATDVEDKIIEEENKRLALIEKEAKSNEIFSLLDSDKNGILSASELLSHNELDSLFDNDGRFTIEESLQLIDQKTDLDQKEFFENYYEKLSTHLKFEEPAKVDENQHEEHQEEEEVQQHHEQTEEHNEEEIDNGNVDESTDNVEDFENDAKVPERFNRFTTPSTPVSSDSNEKYSPDTKLLLDEAEKARTAFRNAEQDLSKIKTDIENVKRKLSFDVGPNDEYASLIDDCFEFDDREYIYRLCPFDRTIQKSKSNNGETLIGSWASWNLDNPSGKYKLMKYTNGLTCWNGPARSTNVYLTCGIENKVISVAEPNRCEYEMRFETPTACEEKTFKHDHSEL